VAASAFDTNVKAAATARRTPLTMTQYLFMAT